MALERGRAGDLAWGVTSITGADLLLRMHVAHELMTSSRIVPASRLVGSERPRSTSRTVPLSELAHLIKSEPAIQVLRLGARAQHGG